MPIGETEFAVSCSATELELDEFELQLTKTGDKAQSWMTMFQIDRTNTVLNWNKHLNLNLNLFDSAFNKSTIIEQRIT